MTEQPEDSKSETVEKDITETEMPPPATTKVVKRINAGATLKNSCMVCNKSFSQTKILKYHIRSKHYNLKSKLPTFIKKRVNDVWFERVPNTDNLAEITKVTDNKILVRKIASDGPLNIDDDEEVDVSQAYPTAYKQERIECNECNVVIWRKDFKKHFKSNH